MGDTCVVVHSWRPATVTAKSTSHSLNTFAVISTFMIQLWSTRRGMQFQLWTMSVSSITSLTGS